MCPALKVKTFEFWRIPFWEILEPQIFVRFSVFLISTHSKNLFYLTLMVLKFKILFRLRGAPHFDTPKFCQILSFRHVCLPLKFHVSSVSG